jgi:hypothetical protein
LSLVLWADDNLPVRFFKVALQVSSLFMHHAPKPPGSRSPGHPVNKLFTALEKVLAIVAAEGDWTISNFRKEIKRQLKVPKNFAAYDCFRGICDALEEDFDFDENLLKFHRAAFDTACACVSEWGGPESRARLEALKLLPLYCESSSGLPTLLWFNRPAKQIKVKVGNLDGLLRDCLLLRFNLFHEYLSHAFPKWSKDHSALSEGYLFALEFQWFQDNSFPFEANLVQKHWNPQLGDDRPDFAAAQWLLRRCEGRPKCFATFLLEWAASWPLFEDGIHKDLIAQITSLINRSVSQMAESPRDRALLKAVESVVCSHCSETPLALDRARDALDAALKPFGDPG